MIHLYTALTLEGSIKALVKAKDTQESSQFILDIKG